MSERTKTPPKGDRAVGRLEWAVGIAGALATLAVLGVLVREALTYHEGAPVLISTVTGVTPTPGGYVVQFQTENRGPSTVAEVVVDARLKQGDRVMEQASVTLDYVARKSSRDAGVILRADPASGTLELSASSFRAP
jgi:uncharacterized protein (TIGR02588 family)